MVNTLDLILCRQCNAMLREGCKQLLSAFLRVIVIIREGTVVVATYADAVAQSGQSAVILQLTIQIMLEG